MYGWKSLRICIVCDTLNSDNGDAYAYADGTVLCIVLYSCIFGVCMYVCLCV